MAAPVFDTITWGYPTAASSDFSTGTNDGNDGRHTCGGSNRIVMVGVEVFTSSDVLTNVDYDTVACTVIAKGLASTHFGYLYYLLNPSTTVLAVTRVRLSSAQNMRVVVYSISDAKQAVAVTSGSVFTASGTSNSLTLDTTGTDNCILSGFSFNEATTQTASGGTTGRTANASYDWFLEKTIATGGSNSLSNTFTTSAAGIIGAAWGPVATTRVPTKALLGVGT